MKNSAAIFQHPFLEGMSAAHQQEFLQGASEQHIAAGEILFREGDPANTLYLLQTGHIELEAVSRCGKTTTIQGLGAGDVVGWSWLFPPFAWHFQARVTQPSSVLCCDGGHLLVRAEEDPVFGYTVMRRIAQLVIQRLQATRRKLTHAQKSLEQQAAIATCAGGCHEHS